MYWKYVLWSVKTKTRVLWPHRGCQRTSNVEILDKEECAGIVQEMHARLTPACFTAKKLVFFGFCELILSMCAK